MARDVCSRSELRGTWDPSSCARAGCPRSAIGDAASGCTCAGDAVLVAGACVSPAFADAYCGKGARFRDGACAFRGCPDAQLLDVATGACVSSRTVRELAGAQHVAVLAHEGLACTAPATPVVDGSRVACVPASALCPRGTRLARAGGRCDPGVACRAGEIADPEGPRCVALLAEGSRTAAYAVDVGAWARAVLGPDGGDGSPSLCQPLALRPAAFGIDARRTIEARIAIEIRFPENDVTLARATVDATDTATGAQLPSAAIALVEASVRGLVDTLRALGGEASAAATKTTVRCAVAAADRPFAVPR